jgi:hypothetical protein
MVTLHRHLTPGTHEKERSHLCDLSLSLCMLVLYRDCSPSIYEEERRHFCDISLHGGLYRPFSPACTRKRHAISAISIPLSAWWLRTDAFLMAGTRRRRHAHSVVSLSLCLQLTHDAARKSLRGKKEHIVMRKAPLFEGCEIGETNFGVTTIKIGVQAILFICHKARIQTIGSSSEAQTSCPILFRLPNGDQLMLSTQQQSSN